MPVREAGSPPGGRGPTRPDGILALLPHGRHLDDDEGGPPVTDGMERTWLAHYADGVPADVDVRDASLVDLLDTSVERFGPLVALEFFGAETTFAELGRQVRAAAEGLRQLGVGPGDRVAIVLPNCPQHIVVFHAILRLGAVVVEHNPLYTASEMEHQLSDHGATVAVVWDKAAGLVKDAGSITKIVAVDLTTAMPLRTRLALRLPVAKARASRAALTAPAGGTIPWRLLLSHGSLASDYPRPRATDLAAIQYTSGTTGVPKGAMLTHRNLRTNAAQGRAWVPGLIDGQEVIYAVLPMFHAYGLTLCLTFALSIGARLVLFPRFDVDLVLAAAAKHPPTFLPAVPPIYERLAKAAEERGVDLTSVRFAISGAMSLPASTLELWERVTGGLLIEGYGLTETSPVAVGNPLGRDRRPGAIGVPFPNTEIRVVDPENPSSDRAPGERGELLIRGPQVFGGYWNKPEETREALIDDGWFRTGDIVEVDPDGFVSIVDRIKEIIITGGFNVMPSEVEAALREHPDVSDAAVVGIPRADGSEDVVAAVQLAPGATLDEAALRQHCRSCLAAYKVPRRVVAVDDLPRSQIGKVLRKQVRASLINA